MNAEQLSRVGEKLVKRCGSRDPFEIARQLGINVMLCENFGSLKGMYLSLIHISEPTRLRRISYAVFCLKKKKNTNARKRNRSIN